MSAPTQEEYFAEDFDASTLRVPQLRSILVEHRIPIPGKALKPDLVELFETEVRPKGNRLLARAGKVKASGKGIIAVSENGDEAPVEPPKRGRGRPRKTTSEEPAAAPAPKRSRQSTRASRTPALEDDTSRSVAASTLHSPIAEKEELDEEDVPAAVKKSRGRPKKSVPVPEPEEEGDEAEIEDEAEKVVPVKAPRKSRARSKPRPASSEVEAGPVPPLSSSSAAPSSSRPATELHTPQHHVPYEPPKSILKKDSMRSFTEQQQQGPASSVSPGPVPAKTTPSKRKLKSKSGRKSDGEESGFSDANPFQSGSEEQADVRRRRKSTMGIVSSTKTEPITPNAQGKTPRRSEPAPFSFTPGQNQGHLQQLRKLGPSQENLKSPPISVRRQMLAEREKEIGEAERYNRVIGNKLAGISTPARGANAEDEGEESREPSPEVRVMAHSMPKTSGSELDRPTEQYALIPGPGANGSGLSLTRASTALPLGVILLPLLMWLANWKGASSSIGFCDTSSPANPIILAREARRADARACNAQRAEQVMAHVPADQLVSCDYAALPLIPFMPHPTACAPCPAHAECAHGRIVACEPEYLLSDSPLSFLNPALNGLPGVGPTAFPPSCKPDTAKKRFIGEMAREMEGFLARAKGRVQCARTDRALPKGERERKGEGEVYGLKEADLKGVFEPRRDPKVSKEQFDEVWEAALRDLVEHEDVVESIDVDGVSWYAAKRSEMTLSCAAKTKVYQSVDEWKSQLASTMAVLAAIAALQRRFKNRRAEKYRADELAQVVLKRLQDQERLHYTDPSSTPTPYLAPAQMRDLVLPPTGSVASRKRTWERVEAIISKNANVASREREVGGEVWSTWEWTGPAGAALPIGHIPADEDGEVQGYEVVAQRSPTRIKF